MIGNIHLVNINCSQFLPLLFPSKRKINLSVCRHIAFYDSSLVCAFSVLCLQAVKYLLLFIHIAWTRRQLSKIAFHVSPYFYPFAYSRLAGTWTCRQFCYFYLPSPKGLLTLNVTTFNYFKNNFHKKHFDLDFSHSQVPPRSSPISQANLA